MVIPSIQVDFGIFYLHDYTTVGKTDGWMF